MATRNKRQTLLRFIYIEINPWHKVPVLAYPVPPYAIHKRYPDLKWTRERGITISHIESGKALCHLQCKQTQARTYAKFILANFGDTDTMHKNMKLRLKWFLENLPGLMRHYNPGEACRVGMENLDAVCNM